MRLVGEIENASTVMLLPVEDDADDDIHDDSRAQYVNDRICVLSPRPDRMTECYHVGCWLRRNQRDCDALEIELQL